MSAYQWPVKKHQCDDHCLKCQQDQTWRHSQSRKPMELPCPGQHYHDNDQPEYPGRSQEYHGKASGRQHQGSQNSSLKQCPGALNSVA